MASQQLSHELAALRHLGQHASVNTVWHRVMHWRLFNFPPRLGRLHVFDNHVSEAERSDPYFLMLGNWLVIEFGNRVDRHRASTHEHLVSILHHLQGNWHLRRQSSFIETQTA